MRQLKTTKLWLLSIALITPFFSVSSYSQDLAEAKKLCDNLTAANKAMATRAGYDVDELCGEISIAQISIAAGTERAVPVAPAVVRETVSSSGDIAETSSSGDIAETSSSGDIAETVAVVVAPVAVTGVGAPAPDSTLKPFGYDLFANAPTTFAPAASIPVSADYLLGPGDSLDILFYGNNNSTFSLEINREGFVDFPQLGPVGLAGLTYGEAKEMLQVRVAAQIVGTKVSISMGSLRSMQIFVLGEAFKPGAYTVSSLSTITHALVSSGGVSDIASLRKIQLKRQGKLVATLDLYDLLLAGDTSNDLRVQAADVIYIPTVGDLVSVGGQILRPAIYELKGGESIQDLIDLAGGIGPKAFAQSARLQRINADGFMTVFDVDLTQSADKSFALHRGDHLTVDAITDYKKDIVSLSGTVRHEGDFAWREGMHISDVVSGRDKLTPYTDLDMALLVRELSNSDDIEVFIFSLQEVLTNSASKDNLELMSRDRIVVLSHYGDRVGEIAPYVERLKRQAKLGHLARVVTSGGALRFAGEYPLVDEMSVSDLIELSGGLNDSAYLDVALLVRELSNSDDIEVSIFSLREVLTNSASKDNLELMSRDRIVVLSHYGDRVGEIGPYVERLKRQAKLGHLPRVVTSGGALRFPGEYPLVDGMSVSDLVALSGGLIESAYSQSAEIARIDISNPNRAVITIIPISLDTDLVAILEPSDYVEFRTIPDFRKSEIISLEGEFVFPGIYAFEIGETLTSVIQRAGGFTDAAFSGGSVFVREALKERQQKELDRISQTLNEDMNAKMLSDANLNVEVDGAQLALQQSAIASLSSLEAIGRLVIPLGDIMSFSADDIILNNNDRLMVPRLSQEVSVLGEVHRQTSYLFNPDFSQMDYIAQSGGMKPGADKRRIYVVKANGEVIVRPRSLFLFRAAQKNIGPGDTIIVPPDPNYIKFRPLPILGEVSRIIYELALGAAAINSFGPR